MRKGIPVNTRTAERLKLQKFVRADGTLAHLDHKQLFQLIQKLKQEEDFTAVSAGELNGMLLLIKIYRHIITQYVKSKAVTSWIDIGSNIKQNIETDKLTIFWKGINSDFKVKEEDLISESIILWLCNRNKAFLPFKTFFDQDQLKLPQVHRQIIEIAQEYFADKPAVLDNYKLLDLLLISMQKHPYSIYDQLNFMRQNFGQLLGDLLWQILEGMDTLKEETAFRGGGAGPTQVYDFSDEEYERFSEDQNWMSTLVLLAKSTYVWLAQLSRKYGRQIDKLDQIPVEELQEITSRGFSGIWLIGIWERSAASRRFKQIKGNQDAIASAYSLMNYQVAADLGGDEARQKLQKNAWHFGLRIACDMVPNHMGIDSDWIVDHPDWFLQESESPFPSYSFYSQNISERGEIAIHIEDHYYDESDAAVVFKLYSRQDGRTRYIYHGNDGTSIPWNDTAQLNYLLPEVREAVIREIISIAQKFPVIRFDAAMTLAKKHVQRLWFPLRGCGGAIPSRSRHALSGEEFNQKIPNEFWREVVDRVAVEAPDTLLLAEAFWMMEGYFVRTLGMHRVYNSAFMNMLKAEENKKYRESIKNVLAFNPQILKRFVNFMSNPDEETAIAQFGKNDKYFGVCVLMSTMPGLPMFAHGQIEGFAERYGMEFSKPKMWEEPDRNLIERHKKEIFPLLGRRALFADVENFILYDFYTNEGNLNENVFAYSNEAEGQRSLVLYHNVFQETAGYVHLANKPVLLDGKVHWQQTTLAEAWHLHKENGWFTIFTDTINGYTYIRKSAELHKNGLHILLSAFKYSVFWDVYEVHDPEEIYAKLNDHLRMQGTTNLTRELKRLRFSEMLDAFSLIISADMMKYLIINWDDKSHKLFTKFENELKFRLNESIDQLLKIIDIKSDRNLAEVIIKNLKKLYKLTDSKLTQTEKILFPLAFLIDSLAPIFNQKFGDNWYREALIDLEVSELFKKLKSDNQKVNTSALGALLQLLSSLNVNALKQNWLEGLLAKPALHDYLGINEFEDKFWFNREAFENMLRWLGMFIPLKLNKKADKNKWLDFKERLEKNLSQTEFQLQKLIRLAEKGLEK